MRASRGGEGKRKEGKGREGKARQGPFNEVDYTDKDRWMDVRTAWRSWHQCQIRGYMLYVICVQKEEERKGKGK